MAKSVFPSVPLLEVPLWVLAEEPPDTGAPERREAVFLTLKLAQARLAERVLSDAGVDYVTNVEVLGRTLFGFQRNGVVFYVAPENRSRCAALLQGAGLSSGVIPDAPTERPT